MHIIRRIIFCLLILLTSACNLSSTRFDSAETAPIPDKSQTLTLITENIVVNSKVKVDKEIKGSGGMQTAPQPLPNRGQNRAGGHLASRGPSGSRNVVSLPHTVSLARTHERIPIAGATHFP